MIAEVRFYKNTGLAVNNSLDSIELLDIINFESFTVPDIAIKQDRGIINIRVNVTWDVIEEVDYCRIKNSCYWVIDINMLNDNVASIDILYDAVTSIGIDNIKILDGWCKRRTIKYDEDDYFKYVIDEPFTPMDRATTYNNQWFPDKSYVEDYPVVLSTVNLDSNLADQAIFYVAKYEGEGTVGCAVPELHPIDGSTVYHMVDMDNVGVGMQSVDSTVAGTKLFWLAITDVVQAINKVYSLNAQNTILDAYILPSMYFGIENDVNKGINVVNQKIRQFKSGIDDVIKNSADQFFNKKVFSGQFMKVQVSSVGSGNSVVYSPEDIVPSNNDASQALYYIIPDGKYNGCPTLIPVSYKRTSNVGGLMYGSVTGAEWQRAPFTTSKSGVGAQMITYNTGRYTKDIQAALGMGSSLVNNAPVTNTSFMGEGSSNPGQLLSENVTQYKNMSGTERHGIISSILGEFSNMMLYFQQSNNARNMMAYQDSALEAHFINAPGLVSYFGNIFTEVITGMDYYDMKRFDLFLTAFGYAVNEQLTADMLKANPTFDFIQADSLIISGYFNQNIKNNIINVFKEGIRIWHKKPLKIEAGANRTGIIT